ncbi:FmdB family zinc ribbon protein [Desulforhopalus singaporensis]|uniref:FmdB family zinc ribbon protein n=1 Tax=Desulforhopalus singaporensis TaxID=91360 RepID=UPI000B8A53EF
MPIYKFSCNGCGKVFDKIFTSTDADSVTCGACGSQDVKRVFSQIDYATKITTNIPIEALSGGACKSGFS